MAVATLWLHSISGVFEPWLRRYINFDRFVQLTSTLIFVCIVLHPLLILYKLKFSIKNLVLIYDSNALVIAAIALILLLTYDIGKILQKKYQFFVEHWQKILLISNIGFILIFYHSLSIGSDLQSGTLRILWIFYGTTAILSIIWTYFIKKIFKPADRQVF